LKKSAPARKPIGKKIPDRYSIRKTVDGEVITCLESPNLSVKIVRGRVLGESSARKAPERTVFLDGACDSPPFLDNSRRVYNLDHHTGIIRSFTLSTCEQAAILVMKGLDLYEKKWMIWANDPDLDTILAIWVLLNHFYLTNRHSSITQAIIPILRLEGIIDGLGLELTHFTAFPKKLLDETWEKIESLRKKEVIWKQSGRWEQMNVLDYTVEILKKIDELVFHPDDFKDFRGLNELARCELDDKTSAVVYSADMGIYEIEEYLNRIYRRNPGILILQKSPGHYTIRKSDIFTPLDMNHIYERLNLYDRNVNGRKPNNRWGGAGEIGGSPRETGTSLTPNEIVTIAKEAFYKPNILERVTRIFWIGFLGMWIPILSWIVVGFSRISDTYSYWILESLGLPFELFAGVVVFCGILLFLLFARKKYAYYGGKYPSGNEWWLFFPGILLGAIFGGTWIPPSGLGSFWNQSILAFGFCLFLPIFLEIVYRGVIHGLLGVIYRVQTTGGEWFLSKPVVISAVIYSFALYLVPVHYETMVDPYLPWEPSLTKFMGGFILGVFSGLCRERSESVYPSAIFHGLGAALSWFLKAVF